MVPKMKVVFKGQLPKDTLFSDSNEDSYAISPEAERVAICDGASESYDSKTWAKLLATRYVENPEITSSWIDETIADYKSNFNDACLSWSQKAAFTRGSFSTLLGVEYCFEKGTIDVLSIGDSIAILLDDKELIDSFPYRNAEEFLQVPELLSTNCEHNQFVKSPAFLSGHCRTWEITEYASPTLLCMTDAIGEWAIRHAEEGNPKWEILSGIGNITGLEDLISMERQERKIRVDDVTLIKISFIP